MKVGLLLSLNLEQHQSIFWVIQQLIFILKQLLEISNMVVQAQKMLNIFGIMNPDPLLANWSFYMLMVRT